MMNSLARIIFLAKTKIAMSKLNKQYLEAEYDLKNRDVSKLNFERRKSLIDHAIQNSDFYKEKYKNHLSLGKGIIDEKDFCQLPVLTRTDLIGNFNKIKSVGLKSPDYRRASSSGSTGSPVTVLHDQRRPETPTRWRILNWWGVKPWENQAFIYRYERPIEKRFFNSIIWWPTRRIFFAAADFNEKKIEKFIRRFNRIKPALVQGYVDVVFEFALYLLDHDIEIEAPKMVWVTSAPLFEEQREIIEKAFGAPVCDQYGNTEILLIAAECRSQNGLHIMQDKVHVEFVDENNKPLPPNKTGKILLTDLTNYAFPLIRYEIGDEGKALDFSCSCGVRLPLMENVKGRQTKNIKTPSGLLIRGEHIMAMFNGYMKFFKEIQLYQKSDYSVCLYYVSRKASYGAEEASKMIELLRKRTRYEIQLEHKRVKKIKRYNVKTPLIVNEFT